MKNERPLALVVGGSSGLGLELALRLLETHRVVITGRNYPGDSNCTFFHLDLTENTSLSIKDISKMVELFPLIDTLVYAVGFSQVERIVNLSEAEIMKMFNVGGIAPTMLIQMILKKQGYLEKFIAITSTSQWTPRPKESVYTEVKAGLAMFAHSISFDPAIGKVMVAAPAGMKNTHFFHDGRDTSAYLDPKWVAEQILRYFQDDFEYRFIKILRDDPRVEEVETRPKGKG